MLHLRGNGKTGGYRVYDSKRYTVACLGNYFCDGSHRRPVIHVYDHAKIGSGFDIPLPHFKFKTAYKYKRYGAMKAYKAYTQLLWKLFYIKRNNEEAIKWLESFSE